MIIYTILKKNNKFTVINNFILLFSFFPLIPNRLKGLPVVLLLSVSLFAFVKRRINWKMFIVNSSLFLTYVVSLIITEDYRFAFKVLETALSIIIIPLVFYVLLPSFKITKTVKVKFYKLFIFSSFVFSITNFLFFLLDTSKTYYSNWYSDKFRTLAEDIPLIGQHPIYASVFLSLSIIFFIELYKLKKIKTHLYIYIVVIVSLLIMLFSKGVIIATLLISLIQLFKSLYKGKLIILLSFISFLIFLLIYNRRMNELINFSNYIEINENLSTSIRLGVYDCSIKVFKENWITGYGIGDAQKALNLCYSNVSNVLLKNRFNSHNQYLDIGIKTGFFGLLIFFYFLFFNFKNAKRNNNNLSIYILSFYCIVFLIENILVRQSGVILFFFLITFLNQEETNL